MVVGMREKEEELVGEKRVFVSCFRRHMHPWKWLGIIHSFTLPLPLLAANSNVIDVLASMHGDSSDTYKGQVT
jgi:hypothetical protein